MTMDTNKKLQSNNRRAVALLCAVVLLCAAFVSARFLVEHFSAPQAYSHQIEKLDEKKSTVMKLSVASATVSAAISLIPDDACTPIANQLADFSKDFGVIVGVILLEKYLLTTLGFVFFGIVLPACLVVTAIAINLPRNSYIQETLLRGACVLFIIGIVAWGSIPASVFITDKIEDTYDETIAAAIDSASRAEEITSEMGAQDESEQKAWHEVVFEAVTNPGSVAEAAAAEIHGLIEWAQTALSNFTEGIAVMAVTACVIPVLVPIVSLWVIKFVLQMAGFSLSAPR